MPNPALPATREQMLPAIRERELVELNDHAIAYESKDRAERTRKSYDLAWARFTLWCSSLELPSLPTTSDVVRLFATAAVERGLPQADGVIGRPVNTRSLNVFLAAIADRHDRLYPNLPNPVREVPKSFLRGLRREHGRPVRKKQAILQDALEAMVEQIPSSTIKGKRDRAILLVAFASGGRRRSEVANMKREDIHLQTDGSWIWVLPRSKTDQEGHGKVFRIQKLPGGQEKFCPARALDEWLKVSGIQQGPVFRHVDRFSRVREPRVIGGKVHGVEPKLVERLVKQLTKEIGLDPKEFAAHSIRSGFITDMLRQGVPIEDVAEAAGHVDINTTRRYNQHVRALDAESPVQRALQRKRK